MLWKMGCIEVLLPNGVIINASSIECCHLAHSVVGCISLYVVWDPLVCMTLVALTAYVWTIRVFLEFFLSSS